jgi:peptide/nickel transport system permease protein
VDEVSLTETTTLLPEVGAGELRRALLRLLGRRLGQALGVVLAVTTACFAIVSSLPGDAAFRIAAGRYGYDFVTAGTADAVRAELGLNRPAWQQLLSWWSDIAHLKLGTSLVTHTEVAPELLYHLGQTLQLTGIALTAAAIAGTAAGIAAARRPDRILDRLIGVWIAVTRSLPPFVLALLLIVVFSVQWGLLPAAGEGGPEHLVLPGITLAVGLSGLFARISRDAMLQASDTDHVRFALTRGLSPTTVIRRHVLRNAGVTLISYLGVQAVILIEGVIVVESVFAWPGLGHALVHAVFWRDVPEIQAVALALALLVVLINTVTDAVALVLDPRPRERAVVA